MRLKAHHIFIVVILAPSILGVVFSELQPTSLYKPDTWAGISIALGASILTLVGIITSILTSKENDRRAEFNDNLGEMTRKLEEKMKTNPDKSLIGVYEKSQQKIKSLLEKMEPLKYADGLFGIISFTFFVSSALFAISGYPFKWIVFAFFAGIAFLGGYVIYYMEECLKMDNLSTIPKKKGKLTLLSIKVDD